MNAKPFLLTPAGKDYLWGGERLKTEYGCNLPLTPFAEAWVCSAHGDGQSIAASGAYGGRTLADVLHTQPELLGTHAAALASGEMPVLVKLIDAKRDLSVQVHPDDAYARAHEGQSGKTELWYVLDAAPDASLVYGFSHDITPDAVRAAVAEGTLAKHLQRVRVHRGDVFFIPPGTVHAIGAGILLAEIQQSSNVTYRLYDYDRLDKNGQKRTLHLDRALDVADLTQAGQVHQQMRVLHYHTRWAAELLGRCAGFRAVRLLVSQRCAYTVGGDSFACCLCIAGEGTLCAAGETLPLKKGACAFLPANAGLTAFSGSMELLWVTC